ncbi:response regulator [Microbacterium flavum]|uniref:Response regulator transcription factor n=1 Tax=Microbacterium flavum TaxID=415216 RepID=A0ABS5XYE7_9MICO|nr:response regulator transcription factor [Microbacterium flavum]MBT8798996.1 response regulator transcription factor [Microbacterium flavum]
MLSVGIIEDHPLFREGLRNLLSSAGIAVVAEATSAAEADVVFEASPDVVVVDLGLPDAPGESVVRAAVRKCPGSRIVVLTMAADALSVSRALAAGANAYLVKDSSADEVLASIRAVATGSSVLGSTIASKMRDLGSIPVLSPTAEDFPELTLRERQVLILVADGLSNAAISSELGLSTKTVANYVSKILSTLHVRDRAQLATVVEKRTAR